MSRSTKEDRPFGRLASTILGTLQAFLVVSLASSPVMAQSPTTFPYGGQLVLNQERVDTGGRPGDYDFVFRAFDGPEPATSQQVGPTLERPSLPLTDGRFETRLDFGADALRTPQLWIETIVTQRKPEGPQIVAQSRQELRINLSSDRSNDATPGADRSPRPVTSDAEILSRLQGVRVVISDRQTPGQAHFLVDEESFRQAFGVGAPVSATDISAVGLVAASQLRRELLASRQQIQELEAELGRLRFRVHLTLLLVAVLIASVFLQRQGAASGAETASSVEPSGVQDEADESEEETVGSGSGSSPAGPSE